MQCIEGRPGRIFVLRIDHGEDLIKALEECIAEKDIRCGFIQVLGAVRSAHLVIGPEEPVLPRSSTTRRSGTAGRSSASGLFRGAKESPTSTSTRRLGGGCRR